MRLLAASQTHVGNVREQNQDAVLALAEIGLFIMADGMGGEKAGEDASAQVITSVRRELSPALINREIDAEGLVGRVIDALLTANREVIEVGRGDSAKRGLGSTASVLCLARGLATVGHVGDSRIYLIRGEQVRQLTRDHSVVWLMYERGTISRRELETHPERHLLTQCIGDPRPISIETLQTRVEPGDLFLLCSDGLTGYASELAIFKLMQNDAISLEEKTRRLVDLALAGGGGDNVSVLLAKVEALEESDDWEPATAATTQTGTPPPIDPASLDETVDEAVERAAEAARQQSATPGMAVEMPTTLGSEWEQHQQQLRAAQRRMRIALILLAVIVAVMLLKWLAR